MKKFTLPQYEALNYALNSTTGQYTSRDLKRRGPMTGVPNEMKLSVGRAIHPNAYGLISNVPVYNQDNSFLVDLYHTCFFNWFVGAEWLFHFEPDPDVYFYGTRLFRFGKDRKNLLVYLFPEYESVDLEELFGFANSAITYLLHLEEDPF